VPDLVARICGICPVAYQMSAVHAIEQAFGVEPNGWVRAMRRLFYCGEWIESHALHIHLLAAPDFLGYASAPAMAVDHADAVRRGLTLQALGNDLITLLGGRSVHPVGACVGGFHRAPAPREITRLLARLRDAVPLAEALVAWTAGLPLPHAPQRFTSVSLRHADEYPMNAGRLTSDSGLDIDVTEFESYFEERQVAHSTALHCLLGGKDYLVGPLARLNLNFDRLPPPVRESARATGIEWPSANVFHGIVARAIEIRYAVHEAIRLLEAYRDPQEPAAAVTPRAGMGVGCTEAPRGVLWHRYQLDAEGSVLRARIVPPTSQNQARIEADLRAALSPEVLVREDDAVRAYCETVIRNYDPCISCATHFLELHLQRSP
jgi:coenzyme F420-reducing hydrogenase alpha subunit